MCQICGMQGLRYTSAGGASGSEQSGYTSLTGPTSFFGGDNTPGWGGSGANTQISMLATSDANINGLLSGVRWTTGTLTYSFPSLTTQYEAGYSETTNNFNPATEALKVATRYAMNLLSQYTNMVTQEVAPTTNADLRTAFSDAANPTAYAYYPSNGTKGGDIWYGSNYTEYQNPIKGQYAWTTVLHEVGHALGLKHGHETGGVSDVAVGSAFDQMAYTLMTYRSYQGGPTTGYTNETNGYAQTFMMYDIAALQAMYGANFNTNSGNTTYTWSATTGEMSINGVGQGAPGGNRIFMTLWDGNGIDTYDFSNYSTNLTVNLSPGNFSITSSTQLASLGAGRFAPGNIFNALLFNNDTRSLIENAIGGSGSDNLTGNQGDNTLDGRAGNDTMTGAAGNDTFVYTAGTDTVTDFTAGGTDDSIDLRSFTSLTSFAGVMALGAQVGSNVVFTFSAGNTLTLNNVTLGSLTAADFQLTASVFNEVSGTGGADSLSGTTGRDRILGLGGNDTIDGRGGDDVLDGGEGDDTIYYYASDTASNVTGGNGTDTLLVVGGSAPTGFNLTAQGFEGARHEQSDTGNTVAWNTITDVYNATWQLLTSNRINDDGTRALTTYDRGALAWNYRVEQFNAAGARTEQQTYNDDNTRNAYYWDALSNQTWREYGEDYNAAGQRTIQRIYNDDNSYRFFYWDLANLQTWTNFDEEFNAAGLRHTQRIVYDTGSTRNYYWDVANAHTWTTFDEEFTAGAGATRSVQRIQNDDGTTSQQFWDTDNSQTYSSYVDYMNAAGQRVEQRIFHDQGANAGGYTRVYYDPTNAQPWQQQIDVYNPAGVLVSSTQVPD